MKNDLRTYWWLALGTAVAIGLPIVMVQPC